MDHSRQGAGQPQLELWDSVPSTRSSTCGSQRTVVGLWHWGKEPILNIYSTIVSIRMYIEEQLCEHPKVLYYRFVILACCSCNVVISIFDLIAFCLLGWMGPCHSERELDGATPCPSSFSNRSICLCPSEPPSC